MESFKEATQVNLKPNVLYYMKTPDTKARSVRIVPVKHGDPARPWCALFYTSPPRTVQTEGDECYVYYFGPETTAKERTEQLTVLKDLLRARGGYAD